MECSHKGRSLCKLSYKCLNMIRCPEGHNTWSYCGNICSCYHKDCWYHDFCGFCQHDMLCKHKKNKSNGFWKFAKSFGKRLKGQDLADFASPLWDALSSPEKQFWKEMALHSPTTHI